MELCLFTNLTSEQWAAWVQAIGSIAAIGAAIYIANKQYRDAKRLQTKQSLDQRVQRFEAIRAISEAALEDFSDAVKALRGTEPEKWLKSTYSESMFSDFNGAIRQIPPTDLPTYTSVRALLKIRDLLESAAWNLKITFDHGNSALLEFQECIEFIEHNLRELKVQNDCLVSELDAAQNGT